MPEVRALLLTDVVDSTALTARLGDAAMARLWAQHDRFARDLLAKHGGREIDKSDGFLLLFESARDAVDYALAYHEGLAPLGISARAGLHVGPVSLRENSAADVARGAKPLEVEGIAKVMAARVMSLAKGGQTLLSRDAYRALGDRAVLATAGPDGRLQDASSAGLVAVSYGRWQLQGVTEPIEIFEAGVRGVAPLKPPPDAPKGWRVVYRNGAWMPVREVPHHLPAERDSFVGRTEDLQDIARRLDGGTRLLGVIGTGGTGKTRLVTHYGWTWLGGWPGGVWFCNLAEARTLDGIVYAVARAFDVPLGNDPVVQLGHAIAARGRCLVILDNFEQVAEHAAATLGHWLDRAGEAQFVVTSREVLGLPGEAHLALMPLSGADASALFMSRAADARRGFVASPQDHAAVASLVELLDGLPLAIELAAARIRVMGVEQIRGHMKDRFRLLAGSGARKDRQTTLRATLDWSWDLLREWERAALAQCSAFEGGFTLEAASAVLELSPWPDAPWPVDVVQALVDRSLLRQVTYERFGMLVSIHDYAGEKLRTPDSFSGSGPEAEQAAWRRHGAHFAELGTDAAIDALQRHGGTGRRHVLAAELDNLVAGCRRACVRGDGEMATALLRAAWEVIELRGPILAGLAQAEAVQALCELRPIQRAHVTRIEGQANHIAGRSYRAEALFAAALADFREAGGRRGESGALIDLGVLMEGLGRPDEARLHLDAALNLARELGDRALEARGLVRLSELEWQRGRLDQAQSHGEAALSAALEAGDRLTEGKALGTRAFVQHLRGKSDDARRGYEQAIAVLRETGDRRGEGIALGNLGEVDLEQGRLDDAWAHAEAALALLRETGSRRNEGYILGNLGMLHLRSGRVAEGRTALQAGEVILREARHRVLLALLLAHRAALEVEAPDLAAARAALTESEVLAGEVGAGPESEVRQLIAKVKARLAELGE